MNYAFVEDLKQFLMNKFEGFPANADIVADKCPETMEGDLTINCFRFAKFCKIAPNLVADTVVDFLSNHQDIEQAIAIKAFVNVILKPSALYRDTVNDINKLLADGIFSEDEQKRILIEFSAPNTNKPQHLGHVRNNILGMSLASLLKRVGNDVIEINLVNDRGIHICKSMIAYERTGKNATPESTHTKGDHLVGSFYVKFNQMLSDELAKLKADKPELSTQNDEDLFLETEIGRATQTMLQQWEANDPKVRELWQMMNNWVFAGFAETYKRMGIEFDHTYLESNTYLLGKDIIAKGLEENVFTKRPDGAVVCDLGKLGPKVVLRSDGTSVYITQDIGTTLKKYEDYKPESMIWVVGDEQNLHFQMLFAIMAKLGYSWAKDLFHLSYGMVNLPTGKMKSREGTVVDADDLFDEMVNLAKSACTERDSELDDAIASERAEIIGMGALKFMLLKYNAKTTIMFDPAASIRFEGDTGPYVQYVCARINSIERKANEKSESLLTKAPNWSQLGKDEEKKLAVTLAMYGSILKSAATKRDCSSLVEYLLDVAKAFNKFYRECPVLTAESEELLIARLRLCQACKTVLVDGLKTLTIQAPEAM